MAENDTAGRSVAAVGDVNGDGEPRPGLQFSAQCGSPAEPGGGDGGAGNAPTDGRDDAPSLAVGWLLTVATGAAVVVLGRRD